MDRNMLNFTVGPVMMDDYLLKENAEQVPYFRTPEFSEVMLENEKLLCEFLNSPEGSRAVFITGSGTASMEASVMNFFNKDDKLLVVNGGSFGHRLVELASLHKLNFTEIKLNPGHALTKEELSKYEGQGYTALVMQQHETSTGVLYDLNMTGDFCKKNNMFLLVDAISSFLADELDMQAMNVDAVIMGSQKAVALPPGMSFIVMNPKAVNRVMNNEMKTMYFDLQDYLKNGERGQTPFTPAVGVLLLLNSRLKHIKENGGAKKVIEHTREIARYFRDGIKDLPFKMFPDSPASAVTALTSTNGKSAYDIFTKVKDEYKIFICPNGGELKDLIFRVGHIGSISKEQVQVLLDALHQMNNKGEL
ncbi:MAG: alanine--glyoxylate aminotransferase family protein [Treponema sp.]|nr:alanine--glyoxylate aminotransferase family protein [Treponema sp.]